MIAFLKGQLYKKSEGLVLIDCQGVGYAVHISTPTYEGLPSVGEQVFLEIYHHISESEQRLFGFQTTDEKKLFELVITVKGIGPRLGLSVLSGLPPRALQQAIASGDVRALSGISGIGKKTAERIVLELRDKVEAIAEGTSTVESGEPGGQVSASSALQMEAVSALEALGYRKNQAEQAIQAAIKAEVEVFKDSKTLIKKALIHLNR